MPEFIKELMTKEQIQGYISYHIWYGNYDNIMIIIIISIRLFFLERTQKPKATNIGDF